VPKPRTEAQQDHSPTAENIVLVIADSGQTPASVASTAILGGPGVLHVAGEFLDIDERVVQAGGEFSAALM
jgi:hypothetical protein